MRSDTQPETTQTAPPPPVRPLRDVRGFWRILLAVIAPLPMLAQATNYILMPVGGNAEFTDTVAAVAAHEALFGVLRWFDAAFVVLLVPATFAVAWAARRSAPRLATAGALIALTGFLAGLGLIHGGGTPLAYLTVREGLDVTSMARLDEAAWNDPMQTLASLLFLVGIVIGLTVLGMALWRSRVAPAWLGIALAVGGFTHPFIPNHTAQGIGLAVAAIGFAGASLALLRMRNDDFDLPAARNGAVGGTYPATIADRPDHILTDAAGRTT